MSDSKKERHKKNIARKEEMELRRAKAYRRRQGLSRDEEEAELASYFKRIVAFSIDQLMYFFFYLFFLVFVAATIGNRVNSIFIGIMPFYLFGAFYFIRNIKKYGQTFGCKKTKIVVIREDGKGFLDTRQAFIRWAVYYGFPLTFISLINLISASPASLVVAGLVYLIFAVVVSFPIVRTPLRQGLHDKYAGAVVVGEVRFEDVAK